jgi:hypothetical protein
LWWTAATKLDEIRALGQTELARRYGAPTLRKPVPAIPGVNRGLSTPVNKPVDTKPADTPQAVDTVDTVDKRKAYQREWLRKRSGPDPSRTLVGCSGMRFDASGLRY